LAAGLEWLEPESDEGNVEYKLRLKDPSIMRFQQLVRAALVRVSTRLVKRLCDATMVVHGQLWSALCSCKTSSLLLVVSAGDADEV
jgi:hypothetical protein